MFCQKKHVIDSSNIIKSIFKSIKKKYNQHVQFCHFSYLSPNIVAIFLYFKLTAFVPLKLLMEQSQQVPRLENSRKR